MTNIRPTPRQAILEAAFQLFNRQPRASLADVAKHAGVGRATLHRHFKSRELLMIALGQTAIAELNHAIDEAVKDARNHGEVLQRSLNAIIPLAARQWFLAHEPVEHDQTIVRAYAAERKELHKIIDGAKVEGVFDKSIPTPWIAEAYDNLVYSAWASMRDGHTTASQASDLAWQTLTRGLGAKNDD